MAEGVQIGRGQPILWLHTRWLVQYRYRYKIFQTSLATWRFFHLIKGAYVNSVVHDRLRRLAIVSHTHAIDTGMAGVGER